MNEAKGEPQYEDTGGIAMCQLRLISSSKWTGPLRVLQKGGGDWMRLPENGNQKIALELKAIKVCIHRAGKVGGICKGLAAQVCRTHTESDGGYGEVGRRLRALIVTEELG